MTPHSHPEAHVANAPRWSSLEADNDTARDATSASMQAWLPHPCGRHPRGVFANLALTSRSTRSQRIALAQDRIKIVNGGHKKTR